MIIRAHWKVIMMRSRAERFELRTRVLLELQDDRAYIGNTVNVSESGVYFEIGYEPPGIEPGEPGLMHLMPLTMGIVVPCVVTRVTESGIAIRLLDVRSARICSRLCPAARLSEVAA